MDQEDSIFDYTDASDREARRQPSIHNPTNFEPRDYEVEYYLDNKHPSYCGGSLREYEREVQEWIREMEQVLGNDWRAKIHHCVHCGNGSIRWITAVRHTPSGEVVVFGSDCTNRLGFANKMAFKLAQLQARAEARQVRFIIYNKRKDYLDAHPEIVQCLADIDKPEHERNTFAKDVLGKLDKFGSLSEKQAEAVVKSMQQDAVPKGEAPNGRQKVVGKVLSIKSQEGYMPGTTQLKMLVKLENNSRVWCSVPTNGDVVRKGDFIVFVATFTVSDKDKSFGFGSRPRLLARVPGSTL